MEKNNSAKTLAIIFGVIAAFFGLIYICLYSPSAEREPYFGFKILTYIEFYSTDLDFYFEYLIFWILRDLLTLAGPIAIISIALDRKSVV